MRSNRLTLNSVVGLFVALIALGGYAWTFTSSLRSMELFVPRISLLLIAVGGILVPIRELLKPEKKELISFTGILPYGIAISGIMLLYSWAMRHIGLITSTFFFLMIWWTWTVYRECRIKGSFRRFFLQLGKMAALAMGVTFVIHFLFVQLLSIYLPRTPLP